MSDISQGELFNPLPDVVGLARLVDLVAQQTGHPLTDGKLKDALVHALLGLDEPEANAVLRRVILRQDGLSEDSVPEMREEMEQVVRMGGILEFWPFTISFTEVGGLEGLKNWFTQRQRLFDPESRSFGLYPPQGVLLVGWPGCGKSLSVKAMAAELQVPLVRLDLYPRFTCESGRGQSAESFSLSLRRLEAIGPCVVWLDELDKYFRWIHDSSLECVNRRVDALRTWIEGRNGLVFVAATVNNISYVPESLIRTGVFFDEVFYVDLPKAAEREDIFRIQLARRKRDPAQFDLSALANASEGFSGAEIEDAINNGLYRAFDDSQGRRDLTNANILTVLAETTPLSKTRSGDLKFLENWARDNARPAQD